MKGLYYAIWREGKPFVRNEGGVDILVDVLAAIAPKPVVMVRDEYPQIFEHILELRASSRRQVGLVIIGHPGIGMHMSRFWYT